MQGGRQAFVRSVARAVEAECPSAHRLRLPSTRHEALCYRIASEHLMQFIGLLCRTSDKVAEALEEQELNWKTLIACEKLQFTEPEIQKHDVCREVLTMLAQHDFKHLPVPARSLVTAMFRGSDHSVHVKNMLQHLKDFSRDVSNGMSSSAKRMYRCVQSNLLAEFSRLPKSTWEGTGQGCSLDDKLLKIQDFARRQ